MLLPNHDSAYVPQAKLIGYLLSETHPVGRFKSRLFHGVGYNSADAQVLEQALINITREAEVTETNPTLYGTMYVVDGLLQTPSGTALQLRTVWIIAPDESRPRLVTAYPI